MQLESLVLLIRSHIFVLSSQVKIKHTNPAELETVCIKEGLCDGDYNRNY